MTITFEEIKYFNSLPVLLSGGKLEFNVTDVNQSIMVYHNNHELFLKSLKSQLDTKGFIIINLNDKIDIHSLSKLCVEILGNLLPQTPDPSITYYNVEYSSESTKSN